MSMQLEDSKLDALHCTVMNICVQGEHIFNVHTARAYEGRKCAMPVEARVGLLGEKHSSQDRSCPC